MPSGWLGDFNYFTRSTFSFGFSFREGQKNLLAKSFTADPAASVSNSQRSSCWIEDFGRFSDVPLGSLAVDGSPWTRIDSSEKDQSSLSNSLAETLKRAKEEREGRLINCWDSLGMGPDNF